MNKRLAWVLVGLGVLSIIAGVVLNQVVVPGMAQLPADVDTMRHYDVAYLTLLDAETLQFYSAAPGENPNLLIDRHVKVEEVDGGAALVLEEQTLRDGDTVLSAFVKRYPLDRKTMAITGDFPQAWADLEGYAAREGLVIGWQIDPEKKDYVGWSDDLRATVVLKFEREEKYKGVDSYYFTAQGDPQPIDPAQAVVLGLPPAISINSLATLASSIDSPDVSLSLPQRVRLLGLIQEATEATQDVPADGEVMVPLNYVYDFTGEYWVDSVTGVLLDTHKIEHRAAIFPQEIMDYFAQAAAQVSEDAPEYIPPDTLEKLMPITVNAFAYRATEQSAQDAIDDAKDAASRLALFGTTIPLILGVVGIVLLGGAWWSKA